MRKKSLVVLGMCGMLLCACSSKEDNNDKDDKNDKNVKSEQTVENGSQDEVVDSDDNNTPDNNDNTTTEKFDTIQTTVVNAYGYTSYKDEYELDATSSVAQLIVANEDKDYSKLSQALKDESLLAKSEAEEFIENANGVFEEDDEDYIKSTFPWKYESKINLKRSDNRVVSYVREVYSHQGGAHPFMTSVGHNYDPATGEEIKLCDVCNDYDKLCDLVMDYLSNYEYKEGFNDGWEDYVKESFTTEDENKKVNWIISDSYVEVIYDTYSIGTYALGSVNIRFSFDEYKDLFLDKYTKVPETLAVKVEDTTDSPETTINVDFDGDGNVDELKFYVENEYVEDLDYIVNSTPYITLGDVTIKGESAECGIEDAYLIKNSDGKYYLYIEADESNDWHNLQIYDVNDVKNGPKYVGISQAGSFYDYEPTDANNLYIKTRVDCMGTYSVYRICKIDADGLIVPIDEEYKVVKMNADAAFSQEGGQVIGTIVEGDEGVTVNADIENVECYELEKGEASKTTVTLSKGTKIYPYATNGIDVMKFIDKDGKCYILKYDDEALRTINGIKDEDLLGGIFYAG